MMRSPAVLWSSVICSTFLAASLWVAAPANAQAPEKERRANRLAGESSPYLLLHAHNPVDWYPWGPEALDKARAENKPIFLSIGYSSCYWCHVMERQVFENEKIAAYMNEHFINIKVDREERPDLDDIYMLSLQVYLQLVGSSQGGGWPLSMFLTPDGKPIAGGTYFPPEDAPGRPGFQRVLQSIRSAWTERADDVTQTADLIVKEVKRLSQPQFELEETTLTPKLVEFVVANIKQQNDPDFGGLDFDADHPDSPKFPVPSRLQLLQHPVGGKADVQSLEMVDLMLQRMAAGGIRDHLGGGFHRYSTDRKWLVPHFEKMLYDNAQLAVVYLDAYRRTNRLSYREVAEEILAFVTRELTSEQGGFYSALDAETDGIEGQYYVWQPAEVQQVLGAADADLFMRAYGFQDPNPFEHGFVLHRGLETAALADRLQQPQADIDRRLQQARVKLLAARQQRPALLRDEKVLTSWNGLMIQAYAHAGLVLQDRVYTRQAERAALELLSTMRDQEGRLRRTSRDGKAKLNAYLDDYAFLVAGLLELHAATGEEKWLNAARRLTDEQLALFWDVQRGGCYFTTHDHEPLIARTKTAYDSALPSGNSVSARNLVRLAVLLREPRYQEYAEQTMRTFVPQLKRSPSSMALLAVGMSEYLAAFGDSPVIARGDLFAGANPVPGGETPAKKPPKGASPDSPSATSPQAGQEPPLIVAASPTADLAAQHEKLTANAYLATEALVAGQPTRVAVVIDVVDGWHINANPAQPDYVIPTTLSGKSAAGATLADARYPAGHEFRVEGIDEALSVYEGKVILFGTLTVPATAAAGQDELQLNVRYQACNDQNCLRPVTIQLTGKVAIVPKGTQVKAINQKLFAPPK